MYSIVPNDLVSKRNRRELVWALACALLTHIFFFVLCSNWTERRKKKHTNTNSNKDLYANGTEIFNVKSFTLCCADVVWCYCCCDFNIIICITSVRVSNRQPTIKYKANSSDIRNNKQSNEKLRVKYLCI